jgi:hypothetical protein
MHVTFCCNTTLGSAESLNQGGNSVKLSQKVDHKGAQQLCFCPRKR